MNKRPICLSLCDETGIASHPWQATHDVITMDILNGQDVILDTLEQALQGRDLSEVDAILAQPPCTHFAVSGARWWEGKGEEAVKEGLSVVDACLRYVALCTPRVWVLENPVGRLTRWIGKPRMYAHPWEYAGYADDPATQAFTKKTCLFGRFECPEQDAWTGEVDKRKIHMMPGTKDQARKRSIAPEGIWAAIYEANRGEDK